MKTIDEILALQNKTSIVIEFGLRLGQKNFNTLNEYEKCVLYIEMLESEVNNGGFKQYFFNSSGEYAYETVFALKQIKANKMVEFLEEAITLFPLLPIPKDSIQRRSVMNNLPKTMIDKWQDLDQKFFKYPDRLEQLVIDFVVENRKQFE